MKIITPAFNSYRQYRAAVAKNRVYRVVRFSVMLIVVAYLLTLCFPQYLFAHEVAYKNFKVYSRQPVDQNIYKVLDDAEISISKSTIYDRDVSRRVFLTDSHGMYAFLSNKAFRSFANSLPFINNIFVNKTDVSRDLVFLNRPEHSQRSL